jgi:hypothetical protein
VAQSCALFPQCLKGEIPPLAGRLPRRGSFSARQIPCAHQPAPVYVLDLDFRTFPVVGGFWLGQFVIMAG